MYADLFARLKVLMHNTESTQCQPDSRLRGQNAVDFVPEGLKSFRKKVSSLLAHAHPCARTTLSEKWFSDPARSLEGKKE